MNRLSTDELNEMPTELEMTVGLLSKSATSQEVGAAVSMSVRLPLIVHSTLKAMAEHSGLSINRVAVQVLRVGIDAVGDALPAEDALSIESIRSRLIHEAIQVAKFEQIQEGD